MSKLSEIDALWAVSSCPCAQCEGARYLLALVKKAVAALEKARYYADDKVVAIIDQTLKEISG